MGMLSVLLLFAPKTNDNVHDTYCFVVSAGFSFLVSDIFFPNFLVLRK
jgi:hypothetical protein